MKTAKGNNYKTLLNVDVHAGDMSLYMTVPMHLDISPEWIDKVIPWIDDRIRSEKKPAATLEKCLLQIEHHREQLVNAYVKLFDTYVTATTVATRQSPIDKARYDMLSSIPDMKMLRQMCALHIGEDVALGYMLPSEKDRLIDATVAAMKASATQGSTQSQAAD